MKYLLILTTLALPISLLAQGSNSNINPQAQVQMQNINYYNNQIDINDDNIIQTNSAPQQANPIEQAKESTTQGSFFGSNNNDNKPCKDCDEVKQAIKVSHASDGGGHHKRSFDAVQWSRTLEGKMHMKMRKTFTRPYKPKTSYALCFNWH